MGTPRASLRAQGPLPLGPSAPRLAPQFLACGIVPRVLPRLGVLARGLASPPAPLARRSTAGGAHPLSLARLRLAASPAALQHVRFPLVRLALSLLGLGAVKSTLTWYELVLASGVSRVSSRQ